MKNRIYGINKDLFDWAASSRLYKEAVGSADDEFEHLALALGPNETRCYQASFFLMKSMQLFVAIMNNQVLKACVGV